MGVSIVGEVSNGFSLACAAWMDTLVRTDIIPIKVVDDERATI